MADPGALSVAVSASLAVERVGMPEARIILAEAAAYVATAPKSNASYLAVNRAMDRVKTSGTASVPVHLMDASYRSAGKLGRGIGYRYAHDFPGHYVEQQYLPDELSGERFYLPTENGYEKQVRSYLGSLEQFKKKETDENCRQSKNN